MTLLDRINQAQTKDELRQMEIEIILDYEHYSENQKAFTEKLNELDK